MGLSVWHVIVVLVVVLILFGAGKLPQVMGDVAKGIKNFKAGMNDDGDKPRESTADAPAGIAHQSAASQATAGAPAQPVGQAASGGKS